MRITRKRVFHVIRRYAILLIVGGAVVVVVVLITGSPMGVERWVEMALERFGEALVDEVEESGAVE